MLRFMSQRCIITFDFFSLLCQRRSSCWKYRKLCSYSENHYHHKKMVEKNTIIFSVGPYCALLFPRKENIKFSEVVLVVLQLPDHLPYDCMNLGLEILQRIFTCLWRTAIKTLNFLSRSREQLTVVVLVSFEKTLNTFHTLS